MRPCKARILLCETNGQLQMFSISFSIYIQTNTFDGRDPTSVEPLLQYVDTSGGQYNIPICRGFPIQRHGDWHLSEPRVIIIWDITWDSKECSRRGPFGLPNSLYRPILFPKSRTSNSISVILNRTWRVREWIQSGTGMCHLWIAQTHETSVSFISSESMNSPRH
jgi:hypothetical protein